MVRTAAGAGAGSRGVTRVKAERFTRLPYVDERVLTYSVSSAVVGFCVFLCLLFGYSWWGLIEDSIESSGHFEFFGTISKYWMGFLQILLITSVLISLHVALFDGTARKSGKWRFALTPITYPVLVLIAFILLRQVFQENRDFRIPPYLT
jgi:hypothetical protein